MFCGEHSAQRVPLDQAAEFHPLGEGSRACEHCAGKWVEWIKARARVLKEGGSEISKQTSPVGMIGAAGEDQQKGMGIIAGSIGVTGDWSTF